MTALRLAALLIVVYAVVLIVGVLAAGGGPGIERPAWLPPLWLRVSVPLAVAAGLWFARNWAWWCGVAMCSGLALWSALSTLVLWLGGYFTGEGAGPRVLNLGLLLGTLLGALALLVSRRGRATKNLSTLHRP
ncbi:MAG: hypothetical protein DMD86_03960 [Candidatus Rokuibacteriota bacterium]|nr:MAG: hypothetical protein DMD86_03960 [Candidatus Rokubacteria bacterium]